jgi:hypothetical protein
MYSRFTVFYIPSRSVPGSGVGCQGSNQRYCLYLEVLNLITIKEKEVMPKHVSQKTHEQQKLRYNERARKFAHKGWSKWSPEDVQKVIDHKIHDSLLGKQIGRSLQAIHAVRNRRKQVSFA